MGPSRLDQRVEELGGEAISVEGELSQEGRNNQ